MNSLIHWLPLENAELDHERTLLLMTDNRIVAGVSLEDEPNVIIISEKYAVNTTKLPPNKFFYCYQSDIEYFDLQ